MRTNPRELSAIKVWLRRALPCSTAYAVAAFVHLLLAVLLSFNLLVSPRAEQPVLPVEISLAPRPEVTLPPVEPRPASLADAVTDEAPEIEFDEPLDDQVGGDVGALTDSPGVIGFGAGGGGGRGGGGRGLGGAGGPSKGSQAAMHAGLDWLMRHRTRSGGWGSIPRDHAQTGKMPRRANAARTSLALLCFLSAGHGPERAGPYQEQVLEARDWLVRQVDDDGKATRYETSNSAYEQALVTLVLAECLQREEVRRVRSAVERAVRACEARQATGRGWRYKPRRGSDTSVTSWMVLALKSAAAADVPVHRDTFAGVRAYLDDVSQRAGTTGYRLGGSDTNRAMNATGLFLRVVLGESPDTPRNRAATRLVLSQSGVMVGWSRYRRLRTQGMGIGNLYQLYYAALALYQVGGEPWKQFNGRVRDELIGHQIKKGCERGSWLGGGRLENPILSTTFATLILETYFRYVRAHALPEAATPPPESAPGEERLQEAHRLAGVARAKGNRKALRLALVACDAALTELKTHGQGHGEMASEARALAIELVLRQGAELDDLNLRERVVTYYADLPRGTRPDPGVARIRRLTRFKDAWDGVAALKTDAPADHRESTLDALREVASDLRRERRGLSAGQGDEADAMLAQARRVLLHHDLKDGPDAAERLWAAVMDAPTDGPLSPLERTLVNALLREGLAAFGQAAREPSREALRRGLRCVTRLHARAVWARLAPTEREQLAKAFEGLLVALAAAHASLGQPERALTEAANCRRRFPQGVLAEQLVPIERAALMARADAGKATDDELARLAGYLAAWSREQPNLPPETALALEARLLSAGRLDAARSVLERALEREPRPTREQVSRLHLGLARIEREAGSARHVHRHLLALQAPLTERLDVRLLSCWVDRRQGRPKRALGVYVSLLPALEHEHHKEWWDLVEETAAAYQEAKEFESARTFLAQVRRKDPTFGDDPQRRRRLVTLIRRLDAQR